MLAVFIHVPNAGAAGPGSIAAAAALQTHFMVSEISAASMSLVARCSRSALSAR